MRQSKRGNWRVPVAPVTLFSRKKKKAPGEPKGPPGFSLGQPPALERAAAQNDLNVALHQSNEEPHCLVHIVLTWRWPVARDLELHLDSSFSGLPRFAIVFSTRQGAANHNSWKDPSEESVACKDYIVHKQNTEVKPRCFARR